MLDNVFLVYLFSHSLNMHRFFFSESICFWLGDTGWLGHFLASSGLAFRS